MILEVGREGTRKTRICGAYREHTGGFSGLKTPEAQTERLQRMLEVWKETTKHDDYLIIGDINVDWNKITDPDYHNKSYARMIYDFTLCENSHQINEDNTREVLYNGQLKQSNIDHIYTYKPELIKDLKTQTMSTSDHKVLKFKKIYKEETKN